MGGAAIAPSEPTEHYHHNHRHSALGHFQKLTTTLDADGAAAPSALSQKHAKVVGNLEPKLARKVSVALERRRSTLIPGRRLSNFVGVSKSKTSSKFKAPSSFASPREEVMDSPTSGRSPGRKIMGGAAPQRGRETSNVPTKKSDNNKSSATSHNRNQALKEMEEEMKKEDKPGAEEGGDAKKKKKLPVSKLSPIDGLAREASSKDIASKEGWDKGADDKGDKADGVGPDQANGDEKAAEEKQKQEAEEAKRVADELAHYSKGTIDPYSKFMNRWRMISVSGKRKECFLRGR